MGFRPEVEDFQPYYKFNKKHLKDLRVGAAVLLEALDVQMTKEEKLAISFKSKKDEEAARVAQVSLSCVHYHGPITNHAYTGKAAIHGRSQDEGIARSTGQAACSRASQSSRSNKLGSASGCSRASG